MIFKKEDPNIILSPDIDQFKRKLNLLEKDDFNESYFNDFYNKTSLDTQRLFFERSENLDTALKNQRELSDKAKSAGMLNLYEGKDLFGKMIFH